MSETTTTEKPKRTRATSTTRAPRQNHGAKLNALKQYLEIKIEVLRSIKTVGDSIDERIDCYIDVLARING